jgi:hypothetical protein
MVVIAPNKERSATPDGALWPRRVRRAASPGYSAGVLAWVEAGGVYVTATCARR